MSAKNMLLEEVMFLDNRQVEIERAVEYLQRQHYTKCPIEWFTEYIKNQERIDELNEDKDLK
jgi:hypothetical protein